MKDWLTLGLVLGREITLIVCAFSSVVAFALGHTDHAIYLALVVLWLRAPERRW